MYVCYICDSPTDLGIYALLFSVENLFFFKEFED